MSSHNLTVIKSFGKYKAGQTITDPTEIQAIVSTNKRHNVVQTFAKPSKVGAHAPKAEAVVEAPVPAAPAAEPASAPAPETAPAA